MSYKPFCDTEIVFGSKTELFSLLASLEHNIVLVMTKSGASRWDFQNLIQGMQERAKAKGLSFVWINAVASNPSPEDIVTALNKIGHQPVDTIIAIGGGSAIDLAKAISAFVKASRCATAEVIIESIKKGTYVRDFFTDIIAVPTTAGTGSEVTHWATIWDKEHKVKYSLDTPGLQPKLAFIVPELTTSLSPAMTLSTGLDAMCQAIEAYWSKHTNPLVQDIAYRSVELIIENLRVVVEQPHSLQARDRLCRASVLAGMAFAKTRTTACHSISYPLTLLFGVPHGFAVALTVGAVLNINLGHFPNDQRLADLLNKHEGVESWIGRVCEDVVTMRLSAFGISANDLPVIVRNAFTAGRMDNNPVDLTEDDVMAVLKGVL